MTAKPPADLLYFSLLCVAAACGSSTSASPNGGHTSTPDSGSPNSGGDGGSIVDAATDHVVGPISSTPPIAQPDFCAPDPANWPFFGGNICNTSSTGNTAITVGNAAKLKTKWVYQAGGDVSATPAVVDGSVYFPDWAGSLNRLDAATGNVTWSKSVATLVGAGGNYFSRATPLVTGNMVIFSANSQPGPAANVVAVDKDTGTLQWKVAIDEGFNAAVIAASPAFDGTRMYVGVGSSEEATTVYKCCAFRGSLVAINVADGTIAWRTHTISDALYYMADGTTPSGYGGVAIWSSAPVIDKKRNQLYVTTGNNYQGPAGAPGTADGDYVDAVLALDLATGAVKWARSVPDGGSDFFNYGTPGGPDSDFGAGANLFSATVNGAPKDLVGAGQKSGMYWALDADTGAVVWTTQVCPGSHLGGIHWGTSTDGARIYASCNNSSSIGYMIGGQGSQAGTMSYAGSWAALDPGTGAILWQVANPTLVRSLNGASVDGPVVAVNGVLFGGSMDASGTMFAFDASNGETLWSFKSGGTVYGGPAVAGGVVYWGAGYPSYRIGFGTTIRKLYAFEVGP